MTDVARKHPLAICEKCPFSKRPFAATTGPADAKIAVISRSPGHYEAIEGKSFSGPSGKVLDHLLKIHGTDRDSVLATNVVLCQSDGQEPGFAVAQACCEDRLKAETASAETVIACGKEATYAMIGANNISQNRGYVHDVSGQRVIVTQNPVMVIRDSGNFPELVRDFRLALAPLPEPKMPKVRWIDDIDEAISVIPDMIESFKQSPIVACDIETRGSGEGIESTGLSHTASIVCAGFSIRSERAVVFGEKVCSEILHDLRHLWKVPMVRYLWHNGKYDCKILRTHAINAKVDEDTMLLSWALDERPGDPESGAGGHSLEWLLKDELGWSKYEPQSVRHFKKTGRFDYYGDTPTEIQRAKVDLYQYNGLDTAGCLALYFVLADRAHNDDVWDKPYKSMLLRLSETFTLMELEGNLYDADKACDMLEYEVWPKLRDQKASMRNITGKPALNPNSPKQLEKLIYDEWGVTHNLLRPKVEKQGKRSTDKYVREKLLLGDYEANGNRDVIDQFAQKLDDFKSLDTQRSRYLEGLVLKRYPNGRIYTDFKIHGTETGRPSSANPNLQNITRTKEGLPNIRSCFVADPGCTFISADLSQAELRAIARLSGDKNLGSIYLDTSRSLHREVAAEFYGENYTYEQYVQAKNINFGVAYWQSAYSFAQLYHMDQKEAQKFIDFWWERFPDVWKWTKEMETQVLTEGEIQSPFGHKRRFYVIPADESGRQHIVKQGINFKPQNIAACITLWALCGFTERLIQDDMYHIAQPRITVHDSILVNCKIDHEEEVGSILKSYLEFAPLDAIGWDFPFLAELSVGPNWGALQEFTV